MLRRLALVAALALTTGLAGCVTPLLEDRSGVETAAAAPVSDDAAPLVGRVDWTGHVVHSATDPLMHTAPTEGVLWPVEQAGIIVEIPEGVGAIEVALSWEGSGEFGIHLHSHDEGTNYVGHRSTDEQWTKNPHCIRVPAADVVPGHWMVMVHSWDAVRTDFTLTVLTSGVTPTVVQDERHGHDTVKEWMEGRSRDEHDSEACMMWTPDPEAHAH